MMEEWKPIPNYEGLYEVSSTGVIRLIGREYENVIHNKKMLMHQKPRIVQQHYDNDGYLKVTLSKNGKRFQTMAHRLVAAAFLENPENKEQVNHINGIKDDNRVENLEWVSPKENIAHSIRTGLQGRNGMAIAVAKLDEQGNILNVYESATKAELAIGKSGKGASNIMRVCRGEKQHRGGYRWKTISFDEYLAIKEKIPK